MLNTTVIIRLPGCTVSLVFSATRLFTVTVTVTVTVTTTLAPAAASDP